MHEIMVKPLPAGCRLTAIFDVSQPDSLTNEHVDKLSAVLGFWDSPWFVAAGVYARNLLTSQCPTEDLPYLVCMLFLRPLRISITHSGQYNAHGVLKEFRHPKRLEMLRQKSSYADVVSTNSVNEIIPCNDPL